MAQEPVINLLRDLTPSDEAELSLLGRILEMAHSETRALEKWILEIPEEARRYFHGLVEAIEVYEAINGETVTPGLLSESEPVIRKLKQIRDMCLEDTLRSVY